MRFFYNKRILYIIFLFERKRNKVFNFLCLLINENNNINEERRMVERSIYYYYSNNWVVLF